MLFQQLPNSVQLALYVQPKASKDAVIAVHNDEFKLAITAPPVDGKANAHVQKLLAKWAGVSKSKVSIVRGELSRHKLVQIDGITELPNIFADCWSAHTGNG